MVKSAMNWSMDRLHCPCKLCVEIYPLIVDGVDGDECYELVLHEARVSLSWTPGTQQFLAMIGDANYNPCDVDYHE